MSRVCAEGSIYTPPPTSAGRYQFLSLIVSKFNELSNGDITEFSHGDDNVVCRFKDTEVGFKLYCSYRNSYYEVSGYLGCFNSQNQFIPSDGSNVYNSFSVNDGVNVFYSNIDDAIICFSIAIATSNYCLDLEYFRATIENHNYVFGTIGGSNSMNKSNRGSIWTNASRVYSLSDELWQSRQNNTNYYGSCRNDGLQYASLVKNSCYFYTVYNYMTISQSSFLDIVSGKVNYVNNSNKQLYILGDENSTAKEVQIGTTYLVNGTPLIATARYLYAFF